MKAKKHRSDFDYKRFGQCLRLERIRLGLTAAEAAEAAGRSELTWLKYEATGEGHITAAVVRFASAYDVSLDDLFEPEGRPVRPRLSVVSSQNSGDGLIPHARRLLRLVG